MISIKLFQADSEMNLEFRIFLTMSRIYVKYIDKWKINFVCGPQLKSLLYWTHRLVMTNMKDSEGTRFTNKTF